MNGYLLLFFKNVLLKQTDFKFPTKVKMALNSYCNLHGKSTLF
jgi:hypothetical protein